MTWPQQIEQWRRYVIWEAKDLPVDLVLAIIARESGGKAGAISGRKAKPYDVPTAAGGTTTAHNDLGLMQVAPSAIKTWNDHNPPERQATIEDMTKGDERAARLQIKIGAWVLASSIRALNQYNPKVFPGKTAKNAPDEQLRMAVLVYGVGGNWQAGKGAPGVKPKLDELAGLGQPLTVAAMAASFPDWKRKRVAGVEQRWRLYLQNRQKGPGAQIQRGGYAAQVQPEMRPMTPVAGTEEKKKGFLGNLPDWAFPAALFVGMILLKENGGMSGIFGAKEEDEEPEEAVA